MSVLTIIVVLPGSTLGTGQQRNDRYRTLQEQAEKAVKENRLDEATRLYSKALAVRPQWADGWWKLGTLEYDQDRYSKATEAFRRLIRLQSSNGTAHAMLGLCEFQLGHDAASLKHLLTAEKFGIVKDTQLRNVTLYHLGVLQLRARRFGDAQETLHQLAKERIRSRELIVALGQAALLMNPRDPAAGNPESANVIERVGQAEALSAAKEFDSAKQIYKELAEKVPDYPNLHFAYGRMLLEAHETDGAVEQFKRELERDPKNVNSMLEIASVRYQVDSQDGLKYAEEAVKLAPGMPFAHYLLGILRLDTGNAAGAIPELEIARRSFPKQSKIYFSLGNAYARAGRKADAARARAEFLRLDKQEASHQGSNVYGNRPSGLAEGQLRTDDRGDPPQ